MSLTIGGGGRSLRFGTRLLEYKPENLTRVWNIEPLSINRVAADDLMLSVENSQRNLPVHCPIAVEFGQVLGVFLSTLQRYYPHQSKLTGLANCVWFVVGSLILVFAYKD